MPVLMLALIPILAAPHGLADLKKAYAQALEADDVGELRALAAAIGKLNTLDAYAFLHRELKLAGDPSQTRALFRAIAFMRLARVDTFLEGQKSSQDPYIRATALEAAADKKHPGAFDRAVGMLTADDDPRARRVAADVLLGMKTSASVKALIEACGTRLTTSEQLRIVAKLKGHSAAALGVATELLTTSNADVRLAAALVLSQHSPKGFRTALEQARKDPDVRVRIVAAAGLDRLQTPGQSSSVRKQLKGAKTFSARYTLYDLIGKTRLQDPVLFEVLKKEARSGHNRIKPKAAETLGAMGGANAVPVLRALLRIRKPWQLRVGAARGLASTRSAAAIPVLIEVLGSAKGRHRYEYVRALESLTGQPFGDQAAVWGRWWAERGADFKVTEEPEPKWEDETDVKGPYSSFYGVHIRSEAVTFVCDVSGSMKGQKLETLKKELTHVIRRMSKDSKFNLVFFNADVGAWQKRLVAAKPKTKEKAIELVGKVQAAGGTNIWDALELAMKDAAVDTIVLLSDGSPNKGKVKDPRKIRIAFYKKNRDRMVLLHMIAIGHRSLHLGGMARESGGRYVER